MGQYHLIYNKTKKQLLNPHILDNGLKLLEQVGHPTSTSTLLFILLANSNGRGGGDLNRLEYPLDELVGCWAGDEIVVQGDYAEEGDRAFISEKEMEEYSDVSRDMLPLMEVIKEKFN